MNRFFVFILFSFLTLTGGFYFVSYLFSKKPIPIAPDLAPMGTPTASPSATPTPRPLTFKEQNDLYGPCVHLPTLMYHHIQPKEEAIAANHQYLNVEPEVFDTQMQYLKDRGYTVVTPTDLINFFDANTPLPKKPVLITIDDGYQDNYLHAFPILKKYSYSATIFLSTGLMNNGDYLNWGQIDDMKNQNVLFGNHTWSHKNLQTDTTTITGELTTADSQLAEKGLNFPKTFAYPYGLVSSYAKTQLTNLGYTVAFTTRPGSALCKKQRLELPRVRVGNSNLNNYGL